ncbi:hypothetical protein BH753_gp022 [Bacillus phage Shbh1]|uniref:Uncharacterized protein n=1 Tax=Bacillus phage Shbh1 TaxID=1796992 RepID=A0A142F147_9CAUD|nr:hypothetical protein BH753_gp022 [Bacillus phage Shbh1]AMQ66504.1 hypothetical protein [Bacillus phage Shbh1]
MAVVTISSKGHVDGVNYRPFETINVGKDTLKMSMEEQVVFIANILQEEVIHGSKDKQQVKLKKLRKLQKKFVSILRFGAVSTVAFTPLQALAQTSSLPHSITGGGVGTEITPTVVMQWGLTVALITVAIGVALSGALLATAGIYRMLRKREIAVEWTTDIIKGLIQVLIAVPTVYALFYLSQIVFQNLPMLKGLF